MQNKAYERLKFELDEYLSLYETGLKKQANVHLKDSLRKFKAEFDERTRDGALEELCREMCDKNESKLKRLQARGNGELPFELGELFGEYLKKRCEAGEMPHLRWACQISPHSLRGLDKNELLRLAYYRELGGAPDVDLLLGSGCERAEQSKERGALQTGASETQSAATEGKFGSKIPASREDLICKESKKRPSTRTAELYFDALLDELDWGAHHFPHACLIERARYERLIREARGVMQKSDIDARRADGLDYFAKLYERYFEFKSGGGDFYGLCEKAGLNFTPVKAFYYEK